ncbi:hypothetical protein [Pseudomonas fluorescens]
MRKLILTILVVVVGQANAEQQLIDVQHDKVRGVTCWIIVGTGISFLPDSSLQTQAPASTATDESQAARASLATSMCQNEQLTATPLPQQKGFQL